MDYGKLNTYDNSKDALAYVMHVHGADVLLGEMLKSYFNDYAPHVATLRKNVVFSVSSSGAADILKRNMTADDVARENAFRQAVQRIIDTYGTDRGLVESVVSEFTDALGWNIKITQTSKPVVGTYHAEPQQVEIRNEKSSVFKIGQRVRFGRYNWRVLDVQNGKALLLSENVVELRPYRARKEGVIWENCSLRKYLNGEFLKTFSDEERSLIMESTVTSANNPWFGTNGGSDTKDKVFLLSIEEVVRYFGDSGALAKKTGNGISYVVISWNGEDIIPTNDPSQSQALAFHDQYSNDRIARYNGEEKWWWLRSPGLTWSGAAGVGTDGAVGIIGYDVDMEEGGVRPALWINL